MSEQVKPQLVWLPDGFGGGEHVHVYRAADYAALQAECASLKNSLLAVTTRHFAESWKKRTIDAELEQYLSAGIAQLESQRDKLKQVLRKVLVTLDCNTDAGEEAADEAYAILNER